MKHCCYRAMSVFSLPPLCCPAALRRRLPGAGGSRVHSPNVHLPLHIWLKPHTRFPTEASEHKRALLSCHLAPTGIRIDTLSSAEPHRSVTWGLFWETFPLRLDAYPGTDSAQLPISYQPQPWRPTAVR